jgi:hypothetical protein
MKTRNRLLWLASGASLLLGFTMASAETYKWTDAEGKVHYSDQPPPSSVKEATTVSPKKKTSRSAPQPETSPADANAAPADGNAAAKPKTYQEQDAEFKQRQVKAAEKEAEDKKKAAEAAENKRNCEQARANVTRLQEGGRIARANDKGETEYLDEQQIAQELAAARKIQDSWCK